MFDKELFDKRREDYTNYIKSRQWRLKRIQKAKQAKYICQDCGKLVKQGFEIHHLTYKHFKNEPLSDLVFLCSDCHLNRHFGNNVNQDEMRSVKHKREKYELKQELFVDIWSKQENQEKHKVGRKYIGPNPNTKFKVVDLYFCKQCKHVTMKQWNMYNLYYCKLRKQFCNAKCAAYWNKNDKF